MFYCKNYDTTITTLKEKVKAGVNAVQIFDSWGGMYLQWIIKNSHEIHQQIIEAWQM
jgi:uroporphyrinogen decarboxylase